MIVRNFSGVAALKIANAALGVLIAALLARTLGAEGYGVYSFALVIVMVLSIVLRFGMPQLVIRETATALSDGNWPRMRQVWRWATRVTLALAALGAIILGLGLWLFSDGGTSVQSLTLSIGVLLVPLLALATLPGAALRGLGNVVLGPLPELVLRPLVLLVLLLGMLAAATAVTPPRALALNVVASAVVIAIGAWLLWSRAPEAVKSARAAPGADPGWWRAIFAIATSAGMYEVNNYADILVLGLFRPADEVGVYRIAHQVSMLVVFGMQVLAIIAGQQIARLYYQSDIAGLQYYVTMTARVSVLVAAPLSVIFILFGQQILTTIFGPQFGAGHIPLAILAAAQLGNAYFGTIGVLLVMTGRERSLARATTIAAIGNVCLNFLLIPLYGMEGAAVATLVSLLARNLLLWRSVRDHLGIDSHALAAVTPLPAAARTGADDEDGPAPTPGRAPGRTGFRSGIGRDVARRPDPRPPKPSSR